jgi:hypothetical protein
MVRTWLDAAVIGCAKDAGRASPVPRQQFVELDGRLIVDPAEHFGETGLLTDVVQLAVSNVKIAGAYDASSPPLASPPVDHVLAAVV